MNVKVRLKAILTSFARTIFFLEGLMASSLLSFSSAFTDSGLVVTGKFCLDHSKSFVFRTFTSSTSKIECPLMTVIIITTIMIINQIYIALNTECVSESVSLSQEL